MWIQIACFQNTWKGGSPYLCQICPKTEKKQSKRVFVSIQKCHTLSVCLCVCMCACVCLENGADVNDDNLNRILLIFGTIYRKVGHKSPLAMRLDGCVSACTSMCVSACARGSLCAIKECNGWRKTEKTLEKWKEYVAAIGHGWRRLYDKRGQRDQ